MNPSWLLLLVGFAYKSLKTSGSFMGDFGRFIHTEPNNVIELLNTMYVTNPMQYFVNYYNRKVQL